MRTHDFTLRISPVELEEWRAEAERQGISVASLVREAVKHKLKVERALELQEQAEEDRERRRERADLLLAERERMRRWRR